MNFLKVFYSIIRIIKKYSLDANHRKVPAIQIESSMVTISII